LTPSPAASGGASSSTRILFGDSQTLLLDEPTNHLDADSVTWLRDHLKNYRGGLLVISHDVDLVEQVVNKVFYLDANRSVLDIYNVGWKAYLTQRETDERRRKRERANAEKQASALQLQAAKLGAKATKAKAAQNMAAPGRTAARRAGRRAAVRPGGQAALPRARAVRQDAADRERTVEVLRLPRGIHRRRPGHRPGFSRVVVLGLNGAGKTTLLRHAGRRREAGHRRGRPRSRPKARLLRAGARDTRYRAVAYREHAHRRA
jgi:ATPase subunit of ABC transporter with duplicated ATPase domains